MGIQYGFGGVYSRPRPNCNPEMDLLDLGLGLEGKIGDAGVGLGDCDEWEGGRMGEDVGRWSLPGRWIHWSRR